MTLPLLSLSQPLRKVLAASVVLVAVCLARPTIGAELEIVGAAGVLLEEAVAKELALTPSQREALYDLVDQRELEGIDQAIAVQRLPREERLKRLARFRQETVERALQLLSQAQRTRFEGLIEKRTDPALSLSSAPPAPAPVPTPSTPAAAEAPATSTPAAAPQEPESLGTISPAVAPPAVTGDGRLTFNFRYQPWKDVLDWFAEQADLSLVLESPPSGTLNYRDNRSYSVAEGLDVLNSVLLTKGYTLVRRGRMLLLVNLEDGVPPNLVTDVPASELNERGEYELVRVLFRVRNLPAGEVAEELQSLIGPQGKVDVLGRAGMIQVTETAGRIRTIRSVVEAIESPNAGDQVTEFPLRNASTDEVLPVLRQMLGIPEGATATPTGSLKLGTDPLGKKLLVSGVASQIERVREVLKLVDVPVAGTVADTPQLEVYPTGEADAELVLGVLQTLLAGNDSTRIAADSRAGNIVALATPAEHATIRATLAQMQSDARQIEVIPLAAIDPRTAVVAINRLFNNPPSDSDDPDPRAPIVDADLNTNSLLVRATESQLEQIRGLLKKLGESGDASLAGRGGVRMLPYSGASAATALEQVQQFWPTLRANRIRVVSPSAGIRTFTPSGESEKNPTDKLLDELLPLGQPPLTPTAPPRSETRGNRSTAAPRAIATQFAVQRQPTPSPNQPADIVVAPGPGGLIIASSDLEALDQFEQLMRTAAGSTVGGRELAVFYLRFAEAGAAAEILGKVFGTGGGDGGSLMGGIAEAAMGDLGGGLMGDLLGLGGGDSSSGGGFVSSSVDIVPDVRLNALIVYAQPDDLQTIDQLLQILDQRTGPEVVEAGGKPRLIPVRNSSAATIATVVKEVYKNRLESSGASGGGGGGQPNPEEFLRALRGGKGRGGKGQGSSAPEPSKMTIGVDARSNSLIVKAPDPLFEEVRELVRQLDEEGLEVPQQTRVVSLEHTNAQAVKDALESLLGEGAVTTVTESQANRGASPRSGSNNNSSQRNRNEQMRRRMEMFRRMQEAQSGGGRGRPGRGRGENQGRGGRGNR